MRSWRAAVADSPESERRLTEYELEGYNGNLDAGWWFDKTLRTNAG